MAITAHLATKSIALVGLIWILGLATTASSLAISYCSPDNTASTSACKVDSFGGEMHPSDSWAAYSTFQSNGLCQTTCQGSYAFAVLQGNNCWCSDYVPSTSGQVNTMKCNQKCPGYPTEWCGSSASGLFGYYALANKNPSGTADGPPTASTSQVFSSVSSSPSTSRASSFFPFPESSYVGPSPSMGASIALSSWMALVSEQSSVEISSLGAQPSSKALAPSLSTVTTPSTSV